MKKPPRTQLTIVVPASEKNFVIEAAKATGADSLNDFIRKATLKEARAVLGRDLGPKDEPITVSTANKLYQTLNAYIGRLPGRGAKQPAVTIPNLRSFATLFSDRNQAILRWLAEKEPESVHALAERFSYPYEAISKNLNRLAQYGIVSLRDGEGRRKVPVLECQKIHMRFFFHEDLQEKPKLLKVVIEDTASSTRRTKHTIKCKSMDYFIKWVPARGYEMLTRISAEQPDSIVAMAKKGNSIDGNKYKMIDHLVDCGLVVLDKHGHKKRPELVFDGLELLLTFKS